MGIPETILNQLPQKVVTMLIVLAMLGLWTWALGKMPIPGEHGFVYQAELKQQIQSAVGSDIDSLKTQSAETSTKVDSIKTALDQILADYYSKRVIDEVRRRCKLAAGEMDEKARLFDQINKDVNLYRIYSGDTSYVRPTCADI